MKPAVSHVAIEQVRGALVMIRTAVCVERLTAVDVSVETVLQVPANKQIEVAVAIRVGT